MRLKGVAGQLEGEKRRGASRIQGVAAAAEVERPGQQGGRQARHLAGQAGMAVDGGRRRRLFEKPVFQGTAEQLPADPGGGLAGQDDGRQNGADALPVERRVAALGKGIAAGGEYQVVEGGQGPPAGRYSGPGRRGPAAGGPPDRRGR